MRGNFNFGLMLGAGLLAVWLAGCGDATSSGGSGAALSGRIEIDGSSTVYRLSAGAHELFQKEQPDVEITVNFAGTGAGFTKFLEEKIDVLDASRPILQNEIDKAREKGVEYLELPVAFDALTVAVSAENDWASEMTVADLKKLWEPAAKGQVMRWSDLNPAWPEEKITLFGAGHDSGTFDYFTEAVVGKRGSIRTDATATEDDNVIVQGIAADKYALGYLPFAYYEPNKNKLKALAIDWKPNDESGAVKPSAETVRAGQYNPLSRPLFLYVNKKSLARPEVQAFVKFYLSHAAELSRRLRYVPLPEAAYEMALDRLAKQQVGTGFGGKSEIGLPIEDILKREPKS